MAFNGNNKIIMKIVLISCIFFSAQHLSCYRDMVR